MNKKRIWKLLTVGIAFLLVISVSPEVRLLGMFIEVIGLDMFVLLFEVQILAILLASYHRVLRPIMMRVNALLERLDPFYFISSSAALRACPAMIMHSVPLLVSSYLVVFLGISAYS